MTQGKKKLCGVRSRVDSACGHEHTGKTLHGCPVCEHPDDRACAAVGHELHKEQVNEERGKQHGP